VPLRRVLGELMAAAALLAATLKFEGTLILQLHGNGPVRLIVVECAAGTRCAQPPNGTAKSPRAICAHC